MTGNQCFEQEVCRLTIMLFEWLAEWHKLVCMFRSATFGKPPEIGEGLHDVSCVCM